MLPATKTAKNIYEWPLNSRIRGFLRYENLVLQAQACINNDIAALTALHHFLDLTKGNDFKSDLIQNLMQQISALQQFSKATCKKTSTIGSSSQLKVR